MGLLPPLAAISDVQGRSRSDVWKNDVAFFAQRHSVKYKNPSSGTSPPQGASCLPPGTPPSHLRRRPTNSCIAASQHPTAPHPQLYHVLAAHLPPCRPRYATFCLEFLPHAHKASAQPGRRYVRSSSSALVPIPSPLSVTSACRRSRGRVWLLRLLSSP